MVMVMVMALWKDRREGIPKVEVVRTIEPVPSHPFFGGGKAGPVGLISNGVKVDGDGVVTGRQTPTEAGQGAAWDIRGALSDGSGGRRGWKGRSWV